MPGLYLSLRETREVSTSHRNCFWLEGVPFIWSKVNFQCLRLLGKNLNNLLSYLFWTQKVSYISCLFPRTIFTYSFIPLSCFVLRWEHTRSSVSLRIYRYVTIRIPIPFRSNSDEGRQCFLLGGRFIYSVSIWSKTCRSQNYDNTKKYLK